MINASEMEAWLQRTNERYRREDVPPARRPFDAFRDFCVEHNCSFALGSPTSDVIFKWFYAHSAADSHHVGSLFTGTYYFDARFWPISIPIGFGRGRLEVFESLESMPDAVKRDLAKDEAETNSLVLHWADCVDYGYGFDDIQKMGQLTERALAFARNADQELVGAIRQVLHPRPNPKSILAFRMATEIFLKTVLVQERGLSDRALKKLSHTIGDLASECFTHTGIQDFSELASRASVFPEVSERYDGDERPARAVWSAARVAQQAASAFVRRYSDRGMRARVLGTGAQ